MLKILSKTILVAFLLLNTSTATIIFTAKADESSSFDVLDILSVTEDDAKTAGVATSSGETTSKSLVDKGEATGGAGSGIAELILRAINILTLLVGTFAFIIILISGFMLVTAQGDQTKIDKAKNMITQCMIGVMFAFFSFMLVTFIQSFFY